MKAGAGGTQTCGGAAAEFLAALAHAGQAATMDEAIDRLLEGRPPRRADLAGAVVALGRAVDAIGGIGSLPRGGPAIVLVIVPSGEWVAPVAAVAGDCLVRAARGNPGNGAGQGGRLVLRADGTATSHRPDVRNDDVAEAMQAGDVVLGVSQDPDRLLPRDLVRGAELRIEVTGLDPDGVATTVEAVVGTAPSTRLPYRLAALCDPVDLALAVHAARGADASLARLGAILVAKAGGADDGPRLEDLHGYGAALDWALALVADLRAWRTGGPGAPHWRDLESAILLSGPPGVGKTAFAAALARSAGLPLLAASLGQWQAARDGHLGHTLGAMRSFFERARRAPCIVLVDECDSFGDRARLPDQHRDYSVQVVNAFLEHLSGAVPREGVVVVGATNAPERIDPAIMRPGRLGRHVRIGLPDADDRARILRMYLGDDLPAADLRPLARRTVGMTGADVEALVRRARGNARRAGRELGRNDLEAAAGEACVPIPKALRRRIAVHEAGHVLAAATVGTAHALGASIHAGGGATWIAGAGDAADGTEASLDDRLLVALAGRAAEHEVFGNITSGAASDLAAATELAVAMETRLGFSRRMPLVAACMEARDLVAAPQVAIAVHERLTAAHARALALVRERRTVLERLARALDRHGALDEAGILRCLADPGKAPKASRRRRPRDL